MTAPRRLPAAAVPAGRTARRLHALTRTDPMYCGCGYDDCPACAGYGYEWGCLHCGAAYFGPYPDDGLCPTCRAGDAA